MNGTLNSRSSSRNVGHWRSKVWDSPNKMFSTPNSTSYSEGLGLVPLTTQVGASVTWVSVTKSLRTLQFFFIILAFSNIKQWKAERAKSKKKKIILTRHIFDSRKSLRGLTLQLTQLKNKIWGSWTSSPSVFLDVSPFIYFDCNRPLCARWHVFSIDLPWSFSVPLERPCLSFGTHNVATLFVAAFPLLSLCHSAYTCTPP